MKQHEKNSPESVPESSSDVASGESEIKLAEALAQAKESQEQVLRIRADFENSKKRLERERGESIKYANERLLSEILPIMDSLDRAVASIQEGHDPEKVKQGLKLAQNELHRVLEGHGVEMVKSHGVEFDPKVHEAVGVVVTEDAEEGMVMEEVQKGYLLNGRLVRPSRVKIAQKSQ
jgi:molecular chaperone GrpE